MPTIDRTITRPSRTSILSNADRAGRRDCIGGAAVRHQQAPSGPKTKLKVAYLGLTCEAPIFVAQEKGFFKEEGLDVELVRDGLGRPARRPRPGRYDANHTLIMYLLKPIESGMDVKITGGIHTGCLRIQAGSEFRHQDGQGPQGQEDRRADAHGQPASPVRQPGAGGQWHRSRERAAMWSGCPFRPASWADSTRDKSTRWRLPSRSAPILLGKGMVRTIADQAVDAPYKDEYCCAVVERQTGAGGSAMAAAKVTRAHAQGGEVGPGKPDRCRRRWRWKRNTSPHQWRSTPRPCRNSSIFPACRECRKSVEDAAAKEMKMVGTAQAVHRPGGAGQAGLARPGRRRRTNGSAGLRWRTWRGAGRPPHCCPHACSSLGALRAQQGSCCAAVAAASR